MDEAHRPILRRAIPWNIALGRAVDAQNETALAARYSAEAEGAYPSAGETASFGSRNPGLGTPSPENLAFALSRDLRR